VEQNLRIARFGLYEADLAAGELRKAGLRIKLQDRPFQILAVLLEKPGEILGREELQKRLWPAETFVDFEHGMNTAITKLRQALCDEADNPRYIETLPRRGYRFIAPVTFGGADTLVTQPPASLATANGDAKTVVAENSAVVSSVSSPLAGHLHFRHVIWIALLVFLCGLGTASGFLYLRSNLRPTWSELRITPLNGLPHESEVAFSPDGAQVAFAWNGEPPERVHIYISQIGAGSPRRLTNSPWWEVAPVWSPDGKYITFMRFAEDPQLNGIYIASSLGGSERKVYALDPRNCTKEIDWSPDGKYLLFGERNSPTEPAAIYLLSLDNLEKRALTFPPQGILGDSNPSFSPDGKAIAFLRDSLDTQEIFTLPVQGGTPRQITFDKRMVQGVSWNASGRALVYSSNRGGGAPSLWLIPATGGAPDRLPFGGGSRAVRPTVARRGNRMAYTNFTYTSDIWRAELPVAGDVKVSPPAKFITSTELEEGPQYSPDGKRIVFQSTRTGNYEIWRCDADGSNLVQLTHMEGPLTGTPRWSPDGREIVFDSRPGGHSQIFVINAEGGSPRQVSTGDSENGVADWSADGKAIFYGSSRGGTWEIWRIPTEGGTPVQITHEGGFAPQPASDGKFIYYAKGRELPGLWRVPVEGGEEVKIIDAPPPTAWAYFCITKNGIYYGDAPTHTKEDAGIYFYDFKTQRSSVVRLLYPFGSEGAPGLSISPDGRYALYTSLAPPTVNVMLVENFRY